MKTLLRFALAVLLVELTSPVTHAAEQEVQLRQGAGLAEITVSCSGCHSLDYIRMNAPFLSADGWKAEITKMRVAFGAPLDNEDSARIAAYLAANYGPVP